MQIMAVITYHVYNFAANTNELEKYARNADTGV